MEITFHKNLKTLIRQRGLTVSALAAAIDCSPKTVSDWLAGGRTPRDLNAARRCAAYFGVTLHFLIFGVEDHCAQNLEGRIEFSSGIYEILLRRVSDPKCQ